MIRVANHSTGPSRCRDCKGRIVWALTDRDKRMPIDAQATIDPTFGTFVLWWDDPTDPEAPQRVSSVSAFEARTGQPYTGKRWTSHYATCPDRKPAGPPGPAPQLSLFKGGLS